MGSLSFVLHYNDYLNEIRQVVKPELLTVLDEMSEMDPHDLVKPDSVFLNEIHARGYVWALFIQQMKGSGLPVM